MGMYVQEIIDYIKRVSIYNLDEETIRSNLLTAGNSEQDIESALGAVKREQKNLSGKVNVQNIQIVTPVTAFAGSGGSALAKPNPPLTPSAVVSFTSYDTIRKSQESDVFLKNILKIGGIIFAFILLILFYNVYGKEGFGGIFEKLFLSVKKLLPLF
jgi:hypothetical protein